MVPDPNINRSPFDDTEPRDVAVPSWFSTPLRDAGVRATVIERASHGTGRVIHPRTAAATPATQTTTRRR